MAEAKMKQQELGVQLASIDEEKPLSNIQRQDIHISAASHSSSKPLPPKLPCSDLINGPRENYLEIGVPLYEASIQCDWEAAKSILDKNQDMKLLSYSITENGETALHVAASAKGPKHAGEFVQKLVDMMDKDDLTLQNSNHNTALYLAAAAGNVEAVKIMVNKNRALLTIAGTNGTMMPLYTAALFGNHDVVEYLYENSQELGDIGWDPQNRGWLLVKCVENDMFVPPKTIVKYFLDVALKIVKKYPELGTSTGIVLGILARKPEVFAEAKSDFIQKTISLGQYWGKQIYSKMNITHKPSQTDPEHDNVTVPGDMVQKNEIKFNIIRRTIMTGKHLYSSSVIGKTINSVFTVISSKMVPSEKEHEALQLLRIIWDDIAKKPKREIDDILRGPFEWKHDDQPAPRNVDQAVGNQNVIRGSSAAKKTYPSRILFVAAEKGNTKFVVELIRQYPDLIWKVNDEKQSIFHIAVKHRHEEIYNLLYEIGSMKDLITPLKDPKDNTMLHLVGKIANQKYLEDVPGVALQMQRDLLWFQEVEAMIPPSYRDRKNKDGLTAYELFTKEHKDLVHRGEDWMKGTANQCMVVAALIATIVFAAAFTVPGGYSQSNGFPVLYSKATFMVFVVADAISLFSSSASILVFLSILTSRYAERDFLDSLPKKMMLGLATLFLSITTMTVAFSVSFFLLYYKGMLWMPILIATLALMPVLLYIKLQYALFVDVIRSTYGSRYLFKPKKHVLYYKNPKV